MPANYIKQILGAKVYDIVEQTPIDYAPFLSSRIDNQVYIKREDLQPIHSFKIRGAYNHIAHLSEEQISKGVVAASAGNHAQGVAYAAQMLKVNATIVMPETTPEIKIMFVKGYGAKVILHGDTFDQALKLAITIAEENGSAFIHPYDDPAVIAGQGTIGMEILRQHSGPLHAVFIPVGGGGLISGIGTYIKYLRPEVKIIGVEAEDSACMAAALEKNRRVMLSEVGLFADGVAVAQVGKEPFKLAKNCVDEVVTVNTDEICAAIKDIFEDTRSIAEPAGALSIAGLKKYFSDKNLHGKSAVAINSGSNTNFDRLRHISERTELGEHREVILAVTIPEKPGSFRKFCQVLGKRNITEFNYRYADNTEAHVFVGAQVSDSENRDALIKRLRNKGYTVVDMSSNELAKLHIRHLVGGRSHGEQNEKLYRFEFPERPGALLSFLKGLGQRWNISLFHYRNHGAAYGRVVVGFQVAENDEKEINKYMKDFGYRFWDESDNTAFKMFLS